MEITMQNKRLSAKTLILLITLLLSSFINTSLFASDKADIDLILSKNTAPEGIVFEIIGSDGEYLTKSLEKIQNYKEQLQKKFPKLDITVVSHGAEQFALTKDNATKFKKAHTKVKRLVADDVTVHICETHASWRDVSAEDFPDYISPSPQGPAQIRQYQELGYTLVVID